MHLPCDPAIYFQEYTLKIYLQQYEKTYTQGSHSSIVNSKILETIYVPIHYK